MRGKMRYRFVTTLKTNKRTAFTAWTTDISGVGFHLGDVLMFEKTGHLSSRTSCALYSMSTALD
jgi:hypothetical protein